MSITELIDHLMEERISLCVTPGRQLRVTFPGDYSPGRELIGRLKLYKEDLVAYLEEESGQDAIVSPIEEQQYYSCSPAQRRLWVLEQFIGERSAYTVSVSYRFEGDLDIEKFQQALGMLAHNHESLRTVFSTVNEVPVQRICPEITGYFSYTDLSAHHLAEEKAAAAMREMNTALFRLDAAPLFRVGLWKTGERSYSFLLAMHHIISDGWSVEVLLHDLISIYGSMVNSDGHMPEAATIQYKEYTAWLAAQSASGKMQNSRAYWLKALQGSLPVLELPTDFPRPQVQTYNGSLQSYTFPAEVVNGFRTMLQQNGATVFMGLTAVLKTLIHRYTGQQDIIIGTPVAGRPQKVFEHQVGFYINTVALRTGLEPNGSFRALLNTVKENTVNAFGHQLYPFDALVDELNITRDTSHSPVFDVLISFQTGSYMQDSLSGMPGIKAEPYSFEHTTSQFDLSFDFTDHEGQLKVEVEYNTDLFGKERIVRLLQHFGKIMKKVSLDAGMPLKEIDFLPAEEKKILLYEFNKNSADYNCEQTLHELFEEQAVLYPGRAAVIHNEKSLSFRELNEAANRLAHLLLQKGIQKGQFVAVHLERGMGLAIAMMGILKSGGAYLPVDPLNPLPRIQAMIGDSHPFALITGSEELVAQEDIFKENVLQLLICTGNAFTGKRPAVNKTFTIAGDEEINAMPGNNPAADVNPSDWCYMLYTSGSTGKPKGAILRHNGSVNHILAEFQELQLEDGFRFLQSANIASDISVWQYLAPWLRGGACVVIDRDDLQLYDRLMNILEQEEVSLVEFVPSYLASLISFLETYPSACLPLQKLRWMMIVGEEVTTELVRKWQQLYPHTGVLNGYGPAEASDDITQYVVKENAEHVKVPIGKPLPNLNIFLLDRNKQLVPWGCTGEITVSGVGVGAGYWQLPGKTGEVFIPNPFPGTLGDTIYCTGDQGRWLPDGNLEFLGRIDEQIKIRGFRVEIAEIESVLRQHPEIKDAAVDYRRSGNGEKRLVAYLLKEKEHTPGEIVLREIKDYAAASLNDYMVPAQYMLLESFPTNLSDKVDKKRLPEPPEVIAEQEYSAPENETEEKILRIWKQVLGNDMLGVQSNFFEHGGQSVKAIQIVSRIYRDMGIRAELKDVFIFPTVKKLAGKIAGQQQHIYHEIKKAPAAAYYPLSNAQLRIWISEKMYTGSMAYNMPMKYRFTGRFHETAFRGAITQLLNRHEILRTAFVEVNGVPHQQILPADNDTSMIRVTRMENESEEMVSKKAEALLWQPFNMEKGRLFRIEIIKTGEEECLLFMVFHHIISDGWSEDIFLNELVMCYDSCCKNEIYCPAPLEIQYCDYSVWQQRFLESEHAEQQKAYWMNRFHGPIPLLQLPTDFDRANKKSFEAIDFRLSIPETTAMVLKNMVQQTGTSYYMLLLSALYVLLHRFTGQRDIVIGSPVAGRNNAGLENQLGCYMNTLPLRQQFDPGASFTTLLQQVKENVLEAFSNQDYPFDLLVSNLKPERKPGRLPLFDAGFTWLNTVQQKESEPVYEKSDYRVAAYTDGSRTVKSDCWVHAWEGDDGLLGIYLSFNKDLFKKTTAAAISGAMMQLVNSLPGSSNRPVSEIAAQLATEQKNINTMDRNETKKKNLERFLKVQPSVTKNVVNTSLLTGGGSAIRVVEATVIGASLPKWMKDNRNQVDQWLLENGGILFRGFNANTTDWSQQIADAFSEQQVRYFDQTSPRNAVTGSLYTSTEHPSDQVIHMHNELSYAYQWPLHIMFSCIIPAAEHGETPLADTRKVWAALKEETRRKFAEKGVMYVRNMRNSVGLSWQQVFQTTNKQEVEEYFTKNGIAYQWIGNDHLRTQWVKPAIQVHPVSKEESWFNHCFFYNEHLMDETARSVLGADGELPFNTYYGTGEPVEKETIEEIAAAFDAHKIMFPWQKGDLLLLDNLFMAHGRNYFTGSRKILVSMFNPQG